MTLGGLLCVGSAIGSLFFFFTLRLDGLPVWAFVLSKLSHSMVFLVLLSHGSKLILSPASIAFRFEQERHMHIEEMVEKGEPDTSSYSKVA